MKKGLTIALLMVALVALAASSSAVAPVIQPLPAVIIGDVGDVSGVGTTALHLLRYENVFNLAGPGVVTRQSTTTANLSYYYVTTGTTTLRASNATALAQQLTAGEATALTVSGTVPPAAKKINTSTDLWLSLIHDAGSTTPASAKLATPAANGATTTALAAVGATGRAVVTLYCTDQPVVEPGKTGTGSFVVYSIAGANDDYSPVVNVCNIPDMSVAGNAGWQYDTHATNVGDFVQVPKTATGVGFVGLATLTGNQQGYTTWGNGSDSTHQTWVPALNSAGKVNRAKYTLSGNATTPLSTPGFRIIFASANFVHLGGYIVTTYGLSLDTGSAINYPSAGVVVNSRIYWVAPVSLINQWQDGGKAATAVVGVDERDYVMQFDAIQTQSGDTGTIVLDSLVVDKVVRPPDVLPAVQWGGTGLPFNGASTGWDKKLDDNGTGWGVGAASINAANITLNVCVGTTSSGFEQVNPFLSTPSIFPRWNTGQLIRTTYNLAVSDMNTCPQYRMFILGYRTDLLKRGNVTWGESFNPSIARAKNPLNTTTPGLIASLKTTGSVMETYIFTQNAPTDPLDAVILVPVLDIDQGVETFPIAGYSKPNGTVTLSACEMEVLN